MKINQIIINELSESAQPGVATTTAQTPQAQAAAQAIQKGLEKLQQQSPGLDHSFNTTTAIQEILPDGTVVMDSNLQPSALQNVRKILALGGGANFKVSMSYQGIPSAANMSTVPPAQPGVAEAGNANSGRRGPDYQDNSPVIPGRVEPLPQGLRHHADASRYGGTEPDDEDDRLLGPAQRHRLHQAVTPDDWFDESQEKIAGRHDPDDFDNMVGRLKQLAGAGPLKTVWDPARRVYRNVPHAVQPPQQPKKAKQ
jgi:hypothetical protein